MPRLPVRSSFGRLLGWLVRIWAWTWRVRVAVHPAADLADPTPLVFAFWHGQQMPLVAASRRRALVVMVSHSRDGALQAGVLRALGLQVVRGSSSRGGAEGLRRVLRAVARGTDAAFAVDGPCGPLGHARPGAARAAHRAGARLVPVGSAASRSWVLSSSWDHFEIPLPFARVCIHVGSRLDPKRAADSPRLLGRAIDRARRLAQRGLAPGAAARSSGAGREMLVDPRHR